MHPRLVVVLLTTILIAQASAAPTGARDDLATDGDANSVSVAAGRLAVGTQDLGSRTSISAAADEDVWFLFDILSSSLSTAQLGPADSTDCENVGVDEDCQTHVEHVALSDDGRRMVAAAIDDETESQLLFIDHAAGLVHQVAVSGRIVALSMDAAGDDVVVAIDRSGITAGGAVQWFTWVSSVQSAFSSDLNAAPTAMDLSPDGRRAAVTAGDLFVFNRGTAMPRSDSSFQGTATAVSISDESPWFLVLGTSTGAYRIYTDSSLSAGRAERNIPGNGAVTAIAIDDDATRIAVARGATLDIIPLDPATILVEQRLARIDHSSAVSHLEFADDNEHLVAAGGDHLRLLTRNGTQLFSDNVAGIADVAVDSTADNIAIAHAAGVRLYDAVHDVNIDVDAPDMASPGVEQNVTLTFSNAGNRMASGDLSAEGPTGWAASVWPASLEAAPDTDALGHLSFTVPAGTAPGDYSILVEAETEAGIVQHVVALTIDEQVAWRLEVDPDTASIEAGDSFDFSVAIHNDGNIAGKPTLDLSSNTVGWDAVRVGDPGTIQPGQSSSVILRLTAPDDAADLERGQATIAIGSVAKTVSATVGATYRPMLVVGDDVTMTAGTDASTTITIRNDGNVEDSFEIHLGPSPTGWNFRFEDGNRDKTVLDLAPGAAQDLAISITSPLQGTVASVSVVAVSQGDEAASSSIVLRATATANTAVATDDDGKDSPGLGVGVLLIAALAIARMRRR